MASEHDLLRRAAFSLRRAAKAAGAIDGDVVAWRLMNHAMAEAEAELAAIAAEGNRYALPDSLIIDGRPFEIEGLPEQ